MNKITYLCVHKSHPILKQKLPKGLHPLMEKFWFSRGLDHIGSCDFAILAFDKKSSNMSASNIVGFFRGYIEGGSLEAMGTYVLPKYRNIGMAGRLWKEGIKYANPFYVNIVATSRDGMKLAKRLSKKHSEIIWDIEKNF